MSLLLLALAPTAFAQDCDTKSLQKEIKTGSPHNIPGLYTQLINCDADKALSVSTDAFARVITGEEANQMAIQAINVGANTQIRDWVGGLQSDERSSVIAAIGNACSDSDQVVSFLVETHDNLGEQFWDDRWYRSLSNCRKPEIQGILSDAMQNQGNDNTRFFGVLQVYSRNLGIDAIPTLKALGEVTEGVEDFNYIVDAFADAAQVGSINGTDEAASKAAVAAILELTPSMPPRVVDHARDILKALGDEPAANSIAGYRYADLKHADGQLHYGIVAIETATCKKGKIQIGIHSGEFVEAGQMWPDQVLSTGEEKVLSAWNFEIGDKCKGTSTVEVNITPLPTEAEALKTWIEEQVSAAQALEAKKIETFEPAVINLAP